MVPQVHFKDLHTVSDAFVTEVKKRGIVVIRGVVDAPTAESWHTEAENYVSTDNDYHNGEQKQSLIYQVYWSKAQVNGRQHPHMQTTRTWLNSLWNVVAPNGEWAFDPTKEATYADRQRIRPPGNISGLDPHVDGGTIERWQEPGYVKFYEDIFKGSWEDHDPWNGHVRVATAEFPSPNVCTVFRTYQGWLALSKQGPGDGTLQVVPLLKEAITYLLLRPILDGKLSGEAYQKLTSELYAELMENLVTIPTVYPGDTVWWHPDLIHGVERHHNGPEKSSVLYIGSSPLCEKNARYLAKQKAAFLEGQTPPDYPPVGKEIGWKNKASLEDLTELGRRQMGFNPWPITGEEAPQQVSLLKRVESILGYTE